MKLLALVLLLGSFAGAQCPAKVPGPGTDCRGPVSAIEIPLTVQSSITLVDIKKPLPTPTMDQYIFSFATGVVQVSENGGPYHTLTGPKGDKGDVGATGAAGAQGPAGATGTAGATGAAGSQGIQGAQGVQGPTGPQGSPGASGAVGARGLQGVPGVIVGNIITATESCNLLNGIRTCTLKVLSIK